MGRPCAGLNPCSVFNLCTSEIYTHTHQMLRIIEYYKYGSVQELRSTFIYISNSLHQNISNFTNHSKVISVILIFLPLWARRMVWSSLVCLTLVWSRWM